MGKLENGILKADKESILCESSPSTDGGGHAGMIFKKDKAGKRLLGKTDPIFKTADEAQIAAAEAVKGIRSSGTRPIFKEVEKHEEPTSSKPKAKKKERGSDAEQD